MRTTFFCIAVFFAINILAQYNTPQFSVRCYEKTDSLSKPFAERIIKLNKNREMLSSEYVYAADNRARNSLKYTYDKKGRILEKEEYSWSNYILERFVYEKHKTTREFKMNLNNVTHVYLYEKNKIKEEQVYLGMASMADSLKLGYTIRYTYNKLDSLVQLTYTRPGDSTWFEKTERKFNGTQLIRIEHSNHQQQLDYRDLKYDSLGKLVEEGFWDILHPANWEVYKYAYDGDRKEVLRSNIYIEEWTLFLKGEIQRRKLFDITSEGVLLRQWEEYVY